MANDESARRAAEQARRAAQEAREAAERAEKAARAAEIRENFTKDKKRPDTRTGGTGPKTKDDND